RAGEVAAARQRMSVAVDDLDGRRTLGDFQRLDGRQVCADPADSAGRGDEEPETGDGAPVGDTHKEGTTPAFALLAFAAFAPARRLSAAGGALAGVDTRRRGLEGRLTPRA